MAKIKYISNIDEETGEPFHHPQYLYWCEGCSYEHAFALKSEGGNHDFNGDLNVPTISPSLLERYSGHVCHSFIKAGVIKYENDCTHHLKGQTMQLKDVEEMIAKRKVTKK